MVKNPEANRQDFKGATAHEAWHLEYYVSDGSTSAADTKTATVSGSAQYTTYSGSGTCTSTAAAFGDYPALKASPTGGNSFSIRPPIGYSYVVEGTCPAFMTGFAAAPEVQFTITPGRPSLIQLPLKTYNYVLSAGGPNGQETATVSWSGTIRVMAQ